MDPFVPVRQTLVMLLALGDLEEERQHDCGSMACRQGVHRLAEGAPLRGVRQPQPGAL